MLCLTLVACSEDKYIPAVEAEPLTTEGAAGSSSMGGSDQASMAGAAGASMTTDTAGDVELIKTYAFDTDVEGFRISYYCDRPAACVTVAAPTAPAIDADAGVAGAADAGADAAVIADPVAAPMADPGTGTDFVSVVHDAAVGEPDAGSVRVEIAFAGGVDANDSNLRQAATLTVNMSSLNLTGRTVSARVMSDLATIAKMYVKTGDTFSYADSGETQIPAGVWTTVSYRIATYVDDQASYDISDVREIGLELLPGLLTETPAVIHVDTLTY